MKVELIFPALRQRSRPFGRSIVPPLGLAQVAALTPPGIDVSLTDENIRPVDFRRDVDLVGISAVTLTAPRAYEIADAFRSRGVPVVLGGIHPSFCPDEASRHADAVVIGEAETTWPRLLDDLAAGTLRSVYRATGRASLAGLPVPRRDLFARHGYLFRNTIATTRGCPFDCSFCSVTTFFGRTYRSRPLDEVLAELASLGGTDLFLVDDNIAANRRYARDLFRALAPLRKRWIAQASITIADDEELLDLAAAGGCVALLVGLESVTPESLAGVHKRINVPEEYGPAIRRIRARGIAVHGFFIFGFDEDDASVFERTVAFGREVCLDGASFGVLVPFPGTALARSLDAEGRILDRDWRHYDDTVVFEPRRMSGEALARGTQRAWEEFYGLRSIVRRLRPGPGRRLALWVFNLYVRLFYLRSRARRQAAAAAPRREPRAQSAR